MDKHPSMRRKRIQHTRPTVLLVDDAPNLRESLGTVLELEGYAVETAPDGRVALQALEAGLRPCVIVTDLMMPVMDGFEFRRRQLANPLLASIPLIAYSGALDAMARVEKMGAVAFLEKPVVIDLLLELLREHCSQ